jgi:hypothetical protein
MNTVCLPDPIPCRVRIWIRMDLHILEAGSGSALNSKGALGAQNGAVEGLDPHNGGVEAQKWNSRGFVQ